MTATLPLRLWLALFIGAVAVGFAAGALAMWREQRRRPDSGRGGDAPGNPPARRSQPPRPGYLVLEPVETPWDTPTEPGGFPAVPDHLWSERRSELEALDREVSQMAAEAWKLYRR